MIETTYLKRGADTALPAPIENVQPEANERAPTLMAGETAGTQGKVRVWYPSRGVLCGSIALGLLFILIGLFTTLCPPISHGNYLVGSAEIFFGVVWIVNGINGLKHPRYISTDDAGIAISARKANTALRWDEIISFTHNSSQVVLCLPLGKVKIDLFGYPSKARHEFVALLRNRVALRPENRVALSPPSTLSSPQLQACRGMKGPEPVLTLQQASQAPAHQTAIRTPVPAPLPLGPQPVLSSPQMRACRGMKEPD